MSDSFVGIDLGGTSVKFGLGTADGTLLHSESIRTEAHLGPQSVIDRILKSVEQMVSQSNQAFKAIGIGAPGLVDIKTGTTRFLPNLPSQWVDVPLGKTVSDHFNCPVMVANDARTATLGELKFGFGKSRPAVSLAFFTLGTGVGGGVAIDGKLRLGEMGAAGELGHQTIDPDGLRCGCGNQGCLETLASGPAILGQAVRLLKSGQAPFLYKLCNGDIGEVSMEAIKESIPRDESIREVIEQAAKAIGVAAANVVTAIDPDLIVLGGGVAELGEILTETVKREIDRRVQMFPTERIEVVKSRLGVHAGILGAVALGMLSIENETG